MINKRLYRIAVAARKAAGLLPRCKEYRDGNTFSHFYPYKSDGTPAKAIADCSKCQHMGPDNGVDNACMIDKQVRGDELAFLFCGSVCGYFTPRSDE